MAAVTLHLKDEATGLCPSRPPAQDLRRVRGGSEPARQPLVADELLDGRPEGIPRAAELPPGRDCAALRSTGPQQDAQRGN